MRLKAEGVTAVARASKNGALKLSVIRHGALQVKRDMLNK